jgi:hypothetical protein
VAKDFERAKKPPTFETEVREHVKPSLVKFHQCAERVNGGNGRCSCKARIPRAEAEKLVAAGEAHFMITMRNGEPYVMNDSIVATVAKRDPSKDKVRIHACFNLDTETLPDRCYCNVHLTREGADQLIAERKAVWLTVTRNGTTYDIHNAIVVIPGEIEKRKAEIRELKSPAGKAVAKFVAALRTAQINHEISEADASLTKEQIIEGLNDPEKFCTDYPNIFPNGFVRGNYIMPFTDTRVNVYRSHSRIIDCLIECVDWYWNKLLVGVKLSIHQGKFMTEAPQGMGKLVTGGYDSAKLSLVSAAHERDKDGRKVKPKGNAPDSFDKDDKASGAQDSSLPDPNYAGFRLSNDYEGAAGNALDKEDDPYREPETPEDVPQDPCLPDDLIPKFDDRPNEDREERPRQHG